MKGVRVNKYDVFCESVFEWQIIFQFYQDLYNHLHKTSITYLRSYSSNTSIKSENSSSNSRDVAIQWIGPDRKEILGGKDRIGSEFPKIGDHTDDLALKNPV